MHKLKLIPILLTLGLPLAALGQQTVTNAIVGCYTLEIGSWAPAVHPGNARYQTPPELIRLSEEAGKGMFAQGRFLVRPVIPHGFKPSAFWQRRGSDSLRITWTNGFAGVQLHLQIEADSLHGTARTFTDVPGGPPPPQADVVARRATCPQGEL